MTGTAVAQVIPVAVSPILTRMYSPEEFGLFALYLAITALAAVMVTGRYELAIVLPEKDEDAFSLAILSIALSFIISGLLLLLAFIFSARIAQALGNPEFEKFVYLVPLSTVLMGSYQALNYLCNRQGQYQRMATRRSLQSAVTATVQLLSGKAGAAGLIGGQLAGQLISGINLARLSWRDNPSLYKQVSLASVRRLAKEYRKFPKYLVLAHGINTASGQLPVFLLGAFFNPALAGFYALTQRVSAAPISLVAGAFGDVFRQEASRQYAEVGSCAEIYRATFRKLLIISVVPCLLFFVIAPDLFAFIFGEQWRESGGYARLLAPMLLARFITTPLSSMFLIADKQELDLAWQVVLLVLTLASLWAGAVINDAKVSIQLFSISYTVMYFINGIISYRLSKGATGLSG